jgi:hypothetical protein
MTLSESLEPSAPDTDRSEPEPISIRRLDRLETTHTSNATGE